MQASDRTEPTATTPPKFTITGYPSRICPKRVSKLANLDNLLLYLHFYVTLCRTLTKLSIWNFRLSLRIYFRLNLGGLYRELNCNCAILFNFPPRLCSKNNCMLFSKFSETTQIQGLLMCRRVHNRSPAPRLTPHTPPVALYTFLGKFQKNFGTFLLSMNEFASKLTKLNRLLGKIHVGH